MRFIETEDSRLYGGHRARMTKNLTSKQVATLRRLIKEEFE